MQNMKWSSPLIFLLLAASLTMGCAAVDTAGPVAETWPDEPQPPWQRLATPQTAAPSGWEDGEPKRARRSGATGIFDIGYRVYVRGITQIDGARCEHRPTCSRFAFEAVKKHGFFLGTFLGVDRLMRTDRSSIHRRLPTHSVHRGMMFYDDPVEANDFFL